MSEFKGTPGPWVTADAHGPVEGGDCIQEVSSEHKFFVATCCHYTSREGVKANACLIAAAPELLEALQAVVRVADRATDEFEMARAAIAKALGQ